jgi:LacI family transcriptional regulator
MLPPPGASDGNGPTRSSADNVVEAFRPKNAAPSTRRKKVALLVESSRAYGRGLLAGIAAYARAHRSWSIYHHERMLGDAVPKWLESWRGDGIIARVENRQIVSFLQSQDIPAVDLRGLHALPRVPVLETNDVAVIQLAYEHLAERGFQRFAFCGFHGANYSRRRREILAALLASNGQPLATLDGPNPHTSDTTRIEASGLLHENELADWLRSLEKPVGVIACNDTRAVQLLNAARECEIEVPDEVAVVGIDNDMILCDLADPPLSSVEHNTRRIGYEAATLLDKMMRGLAPPQGPILINPLHVVTRQSSDVTAIRDAEVAAAVRYIREHAHEGIGVDDVVATLPISRSALERRFMRGVGRTIKSQINRERIRRIKDLLTNTDYKLSTIADQVGISHAEYLSVMFKEAVGMTPGAYRRKFGDRL